MLPSNTLLLYKNNYSGTSLKREPLRELLSYQIDMLEKGLGLVCSFYLSALKSGWYNVPSPDKILSLTNKLNITSYSSLEEGIETLSQRYLLFAVTSRGYESLIYAYRAFLINPDIALPDEMSLIAGKKIDLVDSMPEDRVRFSTGGITISLSEIQKSLAARLLSSFSKEDDSEERIVYYESAYRDVKNGKISDPVLQLIGRGHST